MHSMSPADYDLRCYQLARQLHMVPQLHQQFVENNFLYPFFSACLDARAKAVARHTLLCLVRWLQVSSSGSAMQERTIHNLSRQVLSFLCFPQFTPVDAPRSRHLSLGSEARELSENTLTLERLSCTPERPSQEVAIADKETSQALPHPALHNNPSSDPSVPDSSEKETLSPRPLAVASQGTAGSPSPKWALRKPLFLVRLPAEIRALTEVELSTLQHTDMGCLSSPQLYVRMVHFFALNEETLNTYFGRYGQVGCEILRRVPLQDTDMGEAMMHALTEIFQVTVHELLVQDIIVSVDSYRNAVQATRSAYYKELLFVALHEPRLNTHCMLDVDLVLPECAVVDKWEKQVVRSNLDESHRKRGRAAHSEDSSLSSSSSSSSFTSTISSNDEGFVPEILVDGFPYWLTEDQIKVLVQEHGTVQAIRLSVDDRSGAFTGAALVLMSTVEEALRLSDALHEADFKGHKLCSGVVNENLEVVGLRDGVVRRAAPEELRDHFEVSVNERVWV